MLNCLKLSLRDKKRNDQRVESKIMDSTLFYAKGWVMKKMSYGFLVASNIVFFSASLVAMVVAKNDFKMVQDERQAHHRSVSDSIMADREFIRNSASQLRVGVPPTPLDWRNSRICYAPAECFSVQQDSNCCVEGDACCMLCCSFSSLAFLVWLKKILEPVS